MGVQLYHDLDRRHRKILGELPTRLADAIRPTKAPAASPARAAAAQQVGVVFSGQLTDTMLPSGCAAVHSAKRVVAARGLGVLSFLVRWHGDASLPSMMFDETFALQHRLACPVVQDRAQNRKGRPLYNEAVKCHQLNSLYAVSVGVDAALRRGAAWVFRVRVDLVVRAWDLPEELDESCVYTFCNTYGLPSDNALWGTPGAIAAIFAEANGTAGTGEPGLVRTLANVQLKLCWLRADVWLVKPHAVQMHKKGQAGSSGVRHWWTTGNSTMIPEPELTTSIWRPRRREMRAQYMAYPTVQDVPSGPWQHLRPSKVMSRLCQLPEPSAKHMTNITL